MIDAGKYRKKIKIVKKVPTEDADGFQTIEQQTVLQTWAEVKTMPGAQLLKAGVEFSKATTRFVLRYPRTVIQPSMQVVMDGRTFEIVYLVNKDELGSELEIQGREIVRG